MKSKLGDIPSPCNNVCQIDPETGYCRGCFRTIEEISDWLEYSHEDKLELLKRLEDRRRVLA